MESAYPWAGSVRYTLLGEGWFSLAIHIPAWLRRFSLTVNGQAHNYKTESGYCYLTRDWQPGDTVILFFDLPVRRLHADPRVKDCAGKAALARGPIIYCFEQADQSVPVFSLSLPADAEIVTCKELRDLPKNLIGLHMMGKASNEPHEITAIPYFAWANRAKGDMTVWINEM